MSRSKNTDVFLSLVVVLIFLTVVSIDSTTAAVFDKKAIDAAIAENITSGYDQVAAVENAIRDTAEAALDAERSFNKKFTSELSVITEKIALELSTMKFEGFGVTNLFASAIQGIRVAAKPKELGVIKKGLKKAAEAIVIQTDNKPTERELTIHKCLTSLNDTQLLCVLLSIVMQEVETSNKPHAPVVDSIKTIISEPPVGDTEPASPI